MKKILKLAFLVSLLFSKSVKPQSPSFIRVDSIPVKSNGITLKNPWSGGLNFCQFSEIDLNLDGKKDLFVFDRTGNKISTFLNNGTADSIDYTYSPNYQSKFPLLTDWALLRDYNCDGKEDIFTHSPVGISLYKNTSNAFDGLKFEKVTDIIYSVFYPPNGSYINLYVSSIDIPSITDIDDDGDLDIITLGIYGTTAEYHQNKSMEVYGVCDSINKYELNTSCWGAFAEDIGSNAVSLGVSCKGMSGKTESIEKTMHSGSCQLCIDLNGDSAKEILLGGISFNNYTLLTNGGTKTNANMVSKEVNFPQSDMPINLASFPCGFYLDVNNDSLKDLLISPNSAGNSENLNSVLFYKNIGTKSIPSFKFQQNNFLQDEMIETGEGAYPTFFDYNADGLQDLLIGNYGYFTNGIYQSGIALYKNIGTANAPKFDWMSNDYSGLSASGLKNIVPSFGDLDNDGDEDMMIGESGGHIQYYLNTAIAGSSAVYALAQSNFKDANGVVISVGQFSTPQLIDVNRDGKRDLIIGSRNGKLAYYQNTGTISSPLFTKISSNFGNVNVSKNGYLTGYSYPCLFDVLGSYKLIVGSENGYLYYYGNIDGNLSGNFTLLDSMYLNIWEGTRTAPFVRDVNNDGLSDLIVGNYAGGLGFYGGTLPNSIDEYVALENLFVDVFPNPASQDFFFRINNIKNENIHSTVIVYNLIGEQVLVKTFTGNKFETSISNLSSGIYICEISTRLIDKENISKKSSQKLIVLHK